MKRVVIRPVHLNDVEEMLEIYSPYVLTTTVTSEYTIPSYEVFKQRVQSVTSKTPWIVCEIDGRVLGYGYAAPHRTRESYQWSVETSIYVHMNYQRLGIARAIYTAIFEILKLQGYYNIFVGITFPNKKSIEFHRSMGFEISGRYKKSMFKFGEWRDVTWMGLSLRPTLGYPKETIPSHKLEFTPAFREILEASEKMVHVERFDELEKKYRHF